MSDEEFPGFIVCEHGVRAEQPCPACFLLHNPPPINADRLIIDGDARLMVAVGLVCLMFFVAAVLGLGFGVTALMRAQDEATVAEALRQSAAAHKKALDTSQQRAAELDKSLTACEAKVETVHKLFEYARDPNHKKDTKVVLP